MSRPFLPELIGDTVARCEYVSDWVYLVLDKVNICLFNPILTTWTGERIVGTKLIALELEESEWIRFLFSSGEEMRVSLRAEDYECPEAVVFTFRDTSYDVIL